MEFAVQTPRLSANGAEGLTGSKNGQGKSSVRQAAEEFEAVFLAQMMAPLFEGLDGSGLFGGGSSEQVYRSIMVQEYGKAMSRSGGVGIADAVQKEILKLQQVDS